MLFANHHNLDNLTIIVDRNYQITLDFTEECNSLDPLNKKFESFGMNFNVFFDVHGFSMRFN